MLTDGKNLINNVQLNGEAVWSERACHGLFQENTERILSNVQDMMDRLRTQINADSAQVSLSLITACKLSCGKVMFSQVSVCLSTVGSSFDHYP